MRRDKGQEGQMCFSFLLFPLLQLFLLVFAWFLVGFLQEKGCNIPDWHRFLLLEERLSNEHILCKAWFSISHTTEGKWLEQTSEIIRAFSFFLQEKRAGKEIGVHKKGKGSILGIRGWGRNIFDLVEPHGRRIRAVSYFV